MGGSAGADSEPGRGSTFWLTARLRTGSDAATAVAPLNMPADAEARLQRHYAGARVLLVEDDAVNREVAVELLRNVGLFAETAENGRSAVEKVRAADFALILMDVQMPEMDGLEATRAIRALPGRAQPPILALTAQTLDDGCRPCIEAGMNDFNAKPADPAHAPRHLAQMAAANRTGRRRSAAEGAVQERPHRGLDGRSACCAAKTRVGCARDRTENPVAADAGLRRARHGAGRRGSS